MTRSARHPVRVLLSVVLGVALIACAQESRCLSKGVDVEIIGDHPHSAKVPARDVERGAAHPYAVHGDGHQHLFVLTADAMKKLRTGSSVHTRTTSTNAHTHEVTVRCGN